MASGKFSAAGLHLLLLVHSAHSFILLTANIKDVKEIAMKCMPEPIVEIIAAIVAKIAQLMFFDASAEAQKNVSEENKNYDVKQISSETESEEEHGEDDKHTFVLKLRPILQSILKFIPFLTMSKNDDSNEDIINVRKSKTYSKYGKKITHRAVKSDNIQHRSFNSDNLSNRNSDTDNSVYKNSDDVEHIMLSLNAGLKKMLQQNDIQPNFLEPYVKQIRGFFKTIAGPMFTAAEKKYAIKPEIVHFRSEKPSVKLEINANSIVALMKDVLKSEAFNKNLDHIVKQAGILFRTLQQHEGL